MEEYVMDWVHEGSLTHIDIVCDITGLSIYEVRQVSETLKIEF